MVKKLIKIRTTFKKLFDNYSEEIKDNEIVNTKCNMFIKNSIGELEKVNGLIRKSNHDIYEYNFCNGINFKCSNKHLLKTKNKFKLLSDISYNDDVLIYNSNTTKIKDEKLYKKNDYVYDLSLDGSHEYVTPNGLIHHNSTAARILCSKYGICNKPKDNVLFLNGSSKKVRGISFVEDVIEPFLKYPPVGNDPYRIVFIDEGDNLTPDSYKSIRGIIEKYSKFGRFIITCNYISKIPDPVQSRFGSGIYLFDKIPTDFVMNYCEYILEQEKIEYNKKDVQYIIDSLYPDIRKIIGILQRNCSSGKLVIQENILTSEKKLVVLVSDLIELLKNGETKKVNKNMSDILPLVNTPGLQFKNVYEQLFYTKGIPVPCKIIINKYSNDHNFCLSPSMHFMGMVFEIIQSLKDYG